MPLDDTTQESARVPFVPGVQIGAYRLEALIGQGGTGTVYRARDTKLNRPAAIKVLSSQLADAAARRRFQQEAQLASSLNHPHILTVYDAGEFEGRQYLVTELVDGGTLSDWVKTQPRSCHEIAELLTGVADALATAHDAGIIHRDIKPVNVLVTRSGYAKLADFGLAKLLESSGPDADTRMGVGPLTRRGIVVGTVPYMSPEQAEGKSLDRRSDIFSFGSVLYELLAGQRPFVGPSDLDVLNRIVNDAPAPLGDHIPAPLRSLVARALQKNPEHRYQSMPALVGDLKPFRLPASEEAARQPAARHRRRLALAAAALAIGTAVTGWWLQQRDYFWKNPLDGATVERLTDFPGDEIDAAISPDGKVTAFLSDRAGQFDAWVSPTGSGEFVNVTKGRFPALYPGPIRYVGLSGDSTQLWFLEQVSLRPNRFRVWVAPSGSGEPRPFIESGMHPAWSPDGARIAYHTPDASDPIFIADSLGNAAKQIYIAEPGMHNHYLTWSPDGRYIYFVKGVPTTDEMDIWRLAPPADDRPVVPERITHHNSRVAYPAWIDSRTLVYSAAAEDGSGQWLYAIDVNHRIPHRVSAGIAEQYLSVSLSADARRLVATVALPVANLWTVPLSHQVESEAAVHSFAAPNARALGPRYGPDYVLFLSTKGGPDGLWKLAGGTVRELWRGSDGGVVAAPAVSSDGLQIAFAYRTLGRSNLHVMTANGTNVRPLTDAVDVRGSLSWSPDGQWIAFAGASATEATRVYKISVSGGAPVPLTGAVSSRPLWSPDGRFIIYSEPVQGGRMLGKAVTPDGKPFPLPEIWVNFQTGTPYRILPNTDALVYLKEGDTRHQNFFWMDLASGQERQLTDLQPGAEIRDFDISPDGRQILFDRLRDNSDVVLMNLKR